MTDQLISFTVYSYLLNCWNNHEKKYGTVNWKISVGLAETLAPNKSNFSSTFSAITGDYQDKMLNGILV